jgi:tetratricopeptide (TPR) repeat protein
MNVRLASGGLLLVAGAAWAAEPPGITAPVGDVLKELRKIESAAWHGKVDQVRIELQDLSKARPTEPLLRVFVAWCSMPTDDAWNQLKNVSQIYPDLAWAHYGMGRIYIGWKMRDLAKTSLESAMKKDPAFYPALIALGDMARLKDDLVDAEKQYRAALAIADDPEAHAGLGLVLLKKGQADAAKPELVKGIAGWPDQPAALRELVKLQQASKDPELTNNLSALADLQPKDREIRRLIATMKYEAGDKRGALAEYEKSLKLGNPDLETATRMLGMYNELKDTEGEERAANLVASLDKAAVPPMLRVAELREAKKDLEGAEKTLLEALERNPDLADTWYRLGKMSLSKQQPIFALERFRRGGAKSNARADDCKTEGKKLEEFFKLPAKPAKGSVDRIYGQVAKTLDEVYAFQRRGNPKLKGSLKVRVKVNGEGVVETSEVVEDTLNDVVLAGHVVFALRDAEFERKRREPVFEFELGTPVKKGK